MSFRRILVGLDNSSLHHAVFEAALELAQHHQANLMLFHCITADVVGPPPFVGEVGLSSHLVNQAYQAECMQIDQQIQQAQAWLRHYYDIATQSGINTHFDYAVVDAGTGICHTAQTWGADLIVVGRRGRKGLTEALLGSVSNYVLHHADCAVLIIQGAKKEAIASQAIDDSSKSSMIPTSPN
jgi:nucleotide-binding universal stress UspA family protein